MTIPHRRGPCELTVVLDNPDELFVGPAANIAEGLSPTPSGIARIRRGLDAGGAHSSATVTIELPRDQITPQVEHGLTQAVRRYCDEGIASADEELHAIRRDGTQTLIFGAVILACFLLLSEAVLRSHVPEVLRDFFGNGLFLVAAWVGMWYPLDTLLFSGRPHRLERKLLRALRASEIVVRPMAVP